MLFAVTTSRLFTLLYLCVSMLTASGSPLAIHGTTYFDGVRVDVDLAFEVFENAMISHAVLAIGDTMIHADFFNTARKQMVPKKIVGKSDEDTIRRKNHWAHLGKAKFKSPADQEQALQALLSIKLPPYKEAGGKAWDYIQSALETLKERDELLNPDSVVENSRREKEENKTGRNVRIMPLAIVMKTLEGRNELEATATVIANLSHLILEEAIGLDGGDAQ